MCSLVLSKSPFLNSTLRPVDGSSPLGSILCLFLPHVRVNVAFFQYVKLATKIKVYNAAVIPSLLYGTEALTLNERHLKQLTTVQTRQLRCLLGITWQDKVPNAKVMDATMSESV